MQEPLQRVVLDRVQERRNVLHRQQHGGSDAKRYQCERDADRNLHLKRASADEHVVRAFAMRVEKGEHQRDQQDGVGGRDAHDERETQLTASDEGRITKRGERRADGELRRIVGTDQDFEEGDYSIRERGSGIPGGLGFGL
ncbi:MAG: hypothetical protein DMF97_21910 [Acidobacteria bacterium]|nr:MAG: hypothetical protein DMF97_21910 [Acidobacteriota bacterium]